ncbi:HAMP domain-containing histidine kinase [Ruficoccus amylovorans]|uniref:histidine kinase n=1 Tax=Ruficoccus amylovorans TaxID=1804625 RepID=A0A842HH03_9BACT|nr:HAMP domain-containing sensor histidine kinase [Ruficoccus amylovorans]MBC2595460.1 HAMP domain-containing histidine kinase [Ruficoccus amylovorans]
MKIWKRIILGFILVTAIMMAVDFNSLRENIRIIRQVDDLELSKRKEMMESYRVSYLLQRIKSNVREILLEAEVAERPDEIELARKDIQSLIPKLKASLEELRVATYLGFEREGEDEEQLEELERLNALLARVPDFFQSLDTLLTLQGAQKSKEADEQFEEVLEPLARDMQAIAAELTSGSEAEIQWAIEQLNDRVKTAIRLGVYLSVLSIFLSLGIGLLISRSISKPLMKLVESADEIGRGNLETTVELDTKGELQMLAGSFNQMARELKQKIDSIDNVNKELLESNKTKDTFFSIIAHDLRNPFNAILGYSYILSEDYDKFDDEERLQFIKEIDRSSRITFELLENLLHWARSQSDKIKIQKESVELIEAVEGAISSHAAAAKVKNITLINQVPAGMTLQVDRATFIVILNNVISNSLKFTEDGGNVVVSAWKNDKTITLSIKDTGVGMSEETRSKLFLIRGNSSTLGTRSENGTGLGLLLVKDFTERNGGRVGVKSALGKGSEFVFTFPE